ncbi:unnamed protein product [Rhizophagus irregularis]|nr:unnamed protein product [Rhizophagus irregularis]
MFDEDIDAEKEKAFDEFTKEYGQREEDWTIYDDCIGERKYLSDLYIVYPVLIELPYYPLELRSEIWGPSRTWPDGIYWSVRGGLVATQDQLQKSPCEKPTFRKKTFPEKITQNKESEMSDKSKTSDKSKYITLNCIIPEPVEIDDEDEELEQCITEIKRRMGIIGSATVRSPSVAFDDEFDYLYGIVTTASDWYFLMYTPERIYCSKDDYHIALNEKIMKDDAELRRGVKKVMGEPNLDDEGISRVLKRRSFIFFEGK